MRDYRIIRNEWTFQGQTPVPDKPNEEEEHRRKLREKAKSIPVDPKSAVPALKMLQLDRPTKYKVLKYKSR